jgi:hypothetical protein
VAAPGAAVRGDGSRHDCPRCDGGAIDQAAYAYLLGLYLGNGFISRARSTIARVKGGAIDRVALVRAVGCVAISSYWNHWPWLFPEHGADMKHERPITLTGWQREVVDRYPRQPQRGLVHSDGSRVMTSACRGRSRYPRYLLTNTSADIQQIFRDACDAVGIPHRDSRWNTISVARRVGVAAPDAFIGPKA